MAGSRSAFGSREDDGFRLPPSTEQQLADTMFAPPGWTQPPTAAPVTSAEQRNLPLQGSVEQLYQAWRLTDEAADIFALLREAAAKWIAGGVATVGRRSLWEGVWLRLQGQARVRWENRFE